jgi:hypothetical protein
MKFQQDLYYQIVLLFEFIGIERIIYSELQNVDVYLIISIWHSRNNLFQN